MDTKQKKVPKSKASNRKIGVYSLETSNNKDTKSSKKKDKAKKISSRDLIINDLQSVLNAEKTQEK